MKNFYSLIATIGFVAITFAQGSETFEAQTALTGSYTAGSFTGETTGVTVNYQESRDQAAYPIEGKGLILRRNDEPSFVEFEIPNGVGTFKFEYRKAFTGSADRILAVFVDDVQITKTAVFGSASGEETTVYTLSTAINKSGMVKVKISYPTGTSKGIRQAVIDNVSWTANPTMGVNDVNTAESNLVKFINISDELKFAARADVKVLNMNGQVVKSASVSENTSLDVSSLSKGIYIVTGNVNGKTVSQKIIKN